MPAPLASQVAVSVPFEPLRNPGFGGQPSVLTSEEAQSAIEEVQANVSADLSYSHTMGRSGSVPSSTYLLNDSIPSNLSGKNNALNNAKIVKVSVSNQGATALTVELLTHDGDEVNLTVIGSVTTPAQRSSTFTVSYPVAVNKQVAIRLAAASASAKNLNICYQVKGTA